MSTRMIWMIGIASSVIGGALLLRDATDPSIPPAATSERAVVMTAQPAPPPALDTRTTSIDDVLGALAAATTDDERRRLSNETHDALVAALQRDPEGTLAALEAWLATGHPAQLGTQVAVGAMAAVGTPAIQDALVRLIGARADDAAFARLALPTMAFLAQPTRATEAAVRGWTSEAHPERTRTMAHLALGTMATHLASGDTARAAAIVDEYATRLASATTAADRARWLEVLGNARTPAAAQAVSTQLHADDPTVRGRALEALRLAPTPNVDAALVGALDDAEPGVRASAAWSLGYRSPSRDTMRALVAKLESEPTAAVMTKLLDVIWIRRTLDLTAITEAVQRIAGNHPSQAVRAHARALLDNT
jgi:HEAT repeats